jgi:cytochrome oxidase assembly protein ShyY1
MIFNSIRTPVVFQQRRFKPGVLLWVFTAFFLPLFVSLGVWQLNRANEKEQLLQAESLTPMAFEQIDWQSPPLLRTFELSGKVQTNTIFLLDNKTRDGLFGYEAFALVSTDRGDIALSLGWLKGSADRNELPVVNLPIALSAAAVTIRQAPTNPLFGVEANYGHPNDKRIWITQTLTTDWLQPFAENKVLGFGQLQLAEELGLGPVVWQPVNMSPEKHRSYAMQWFGMAAALLGMFLYAGFARQKESKQK